MEVQQTPLHQHSCTHMRNTSWPLEIVGNCHFYFNIMGEHCIYIYIVLSLYARWWLFHMIKFLMTNNIILGHSLLSKMSLYLETAIVFLLFLLPAWCYKNLAYCWPSHISRNLTYLTWTHHVSKWKKIWSYERAHLIPLKLLCISVCLLLHFFITM